MQPRCRNERLFLKEGERESSKIPKSGADCDDTSVGIWKEEHPT